MVLFFSYIVLSRSSIMWKQKKRLVVGGKKHCVYVTHTNEINEIQLYAF